MSTSVTSFAYPADLLEQPRQLATRGTTRSTEMKIRIYKVAQKIELLVNVR